MPGAVFFLRHPEVVPGAWYGCAVSGGVLCLVYSGAQCLVLDGALGLLSSDAQYLVGMCGAQ